MRHRDFSIPQETGYADDTSFYFPDELWLEGSLPSIAVCLRESSLNVNQDKTEWITFNAKCDSWTSSTQLGSLMSEHEDIRRRIELESIAYGRMYSLWLRSNNVSESRRLRLYNDIVLPTLFLHLRALGSDKGIAGQT